MHYASTVQNGLSTIAPWLAWAIYLLLFVSITASIARAGKYFELTSHFRIQYLLASLFCMVVFVAIADGWHSILAVLVLGANLSALFPFYPITSTAVSTQAVARIRLALININHANTDYSRFITWAQREVFDLLVVQEVNKGWANALTPLAGLYEFKKVVARERGSGLAVYSRYRMEISEIALSEGEVRPGLCGWVQTETARLSLLTFHPRAPIRRGHFKLRNEMMLAATAHLDSLFEPKICIGDFNTSPWCPSYRDFLAQTRLMDVRRGRGLLATWPVFLLFRWLMIPIDHCLVSRDIRIRNVEVGARIGSDHLPLILELEILPGAQTT